MALNPIAYTEKVVRSFLRYQLTAYPFADPRLHAQMRALLSLDRTRRSPLLKGPYVSLSRPFRQGAPIDALIAENLLHPHLRERVPKGIAHLYGHQERAIRAIAAGRTTLISTGTGSGKTECFLYPIVSRCLHLRDEAAPPGISAVIVYPMNTLAEDQLMRLRALLAGTGIPFGIYVGKTPEGEAEVAGVRLPAGSSRADYEARLERVRRADRCRRPPEPMLLRRCGGGRALTARLRRPDHRVQRAGSVAFRCGAGARHAHGRLADPGDRPRLAHTGGRPPVGPDARRLRAPGKTVRTFRGGGGRRGMFVARVVGRSMVPVVPGGAWCLFASPVTGTRAGKVVLVQLHDTLDPDTGQRFTVKRYRSEKTPADS